MTRNNRGRDHYAGSLIGQCIGDALGFVVEGYASDVCGRYVEEYLRQGRAGEVGRADFAFGQYTDDSQLARELLLSYLRKGRFDPEDYAHSVAALFAEGRIFGFGRATEQAAIRLQKGASWDEAGTLAPSAGNGSAMRAGAVGLLEPFDRDALEQMAHDQGRITHADPRCSAGAVAIARGVALASQEQEIVPSEFLADLADLVDRHDAAFASSIRRLQRWIELEPEQAVQAISMAGLEASPSALRTGPCPGITPFVVPSVLWSLYAFLRSPEDYWGTICTAIAVGGDVDTTAAMAGAISGAHVGLAGLPESLARRVNDQGTWGFQELVDLARRVERHVEHMYEQGESP